MYNVKIFIVELEEYPSLAEGIGLENRQAGQTARGFESLFLRHTSIKNTCLHCEQVFYYSF